MAYSPKNPNGQATMANSEPVTLASDQSALPVSFPGDAEADIDQIRDQIDFIVPDVEEIRADADAIRVALELLDDTVYTDDTSTHATGTTKGIGIMAVATATDAAVNANDIGMVGMTLDRKLYVAVMDALPAGTNNIGDVDVLTLPALPAGTNNIGDIDVLSVIPGTGATNLGKAEDAGHTTADTGNFVLAVRRNSPAVGSDTDVDYSSFNVSEVGGLWTCTTPSANGGLSVFSLVSAATTNATNIKASTGNVYGWYIYNSNAAARKVAFHNTAGTPTAGASVFFSLVIPPTSGANVEITNGIQFSTGIAITTVTGLAANDSAAVALNDLIITIFYK